MGMGDATDIAVVGCVPLVLSDQSSAPAVEETVVGSVSAQGQNDSADG